MGLISEHTSHPMHCLSGANNLVPIEIILKFANKIKANESFSAYIVLPVLPEDKPTGAPTQRILYSQVMDRLTVHRCWRQICSIYFTLPDRHCLGDSKLLLLCSRVDCIICFPLTVRRVLGICTCT
ncbi:hypothetical protein BRADI_3g04953v3 [Brachypodium distachyon]|uniref:Uncharacterized protein n=1 Tax=Brachypodium distachyon TaxID=15368 RepID=A0A0Q3F1X7_BRADI|nr:hypothetical protein BRADI_3g04953v3 [Brachypodium distachyon]KQJ93493.1 hypothetical protein BRADI_3g04953v3 [Brachypodium distachyon]KQJ93494.1 hypothetical protein BRADI_3g04953v3 [Brachypodium distachyon]KQJ93495.1 hypothetical protein BRADI_3g04953v3 [Brachypodium distachyon]PNT65961.1 hypothetical protein BRADI_3g04953v3 [Brachypodium distachyon]